MESCKFLYNRFLILVFNLCVSFQVDHNRFIVANSNKEELEQFEKNNTDLFYTYHKAVALGEIVAR